MRVLVLGGSGYIGTRLLGRLAAESWAQVAYTSRARRPIERAGYRLSLDVRDLKAVVAALQDIDCVVNCVAGNARSIETGARNLVHAALSVKCRRIVHLSSMSVYGPVEGVVTERAPLDPRLGWYGRAKCEAERHVAMFVRRGGEAVVLRPGRVFGPGSQLWVGRVARWLFARRVGDLGAAGDGWSNLVHVDDVCSAIVSSMQMAIPAGCLPTFNLAAPDSPRWDAYFVDMARAIGSTPVRRISRRQLWLDSWMAGPPLKVVEKLFDHLAGRPAWLPEPLPPALVRLWSQEIRLEATAAARGLGAIWTPYEVGLRDSAEWARGEISGEA